MIEYLKSIGDLIIFPGVSVMLGGIGFLALAVHQKTNSTVWYVIGAVALGLICIAWMVEFILRFYDQIRSRDE